MGMPKILDLLDDLTTKVATNIVNIEKNKQAIAENKENIETHKADDDRHWTEQDRQNFDRVTHFKGYFTSIEKLRETYPTGNLGDYAIVGGTDTVWVWDDETSDWLNTTEQGVVLSVNGRTGEVILTKTDVGLSNVDNTADTDKPISKAQQTEFNKKAERRKITLAEVDSLTLRAGIYDINGETKEILGFSSGYWTVIVGENSGSSNKSASQIWMNYNTNSDIHMYIRKQKDTKGWGEFCEVLTSILISQSEIDRLKQYKGFYATKSALDNAFPTGKDGDYAIVGEDDSIYLWSSKTSEWIQVSGGGADPEELAKKVNKSGDTMTGKLIINQGTGNVSLETKGVLNVGTTVSTAEIQLNGKSAIKGTDAWLRLNDLGNFTSGIFCGNSLIRTDGKLQIGDTGEKFLADDNGVSSIGVVKTKKGEFSYNDKVVTKYNEAEECIDFIFY